jgi:ABC-2 type transport system permease protein
VTVTAGATTAVAAISARGLRKHANAAEWLAAFGVVLLLTFAVTWLCVGLGLSAKSVETASNSPMFLILLPFLGSGFVPASSLPAAVAGSPSTSRSPRSTRRCADC